MNAHDTNTLTRAILGIARAGASVPRLECSNHRRDDHGWPLGNCIECRDYRAKMDAWHTEQVLGGVAHPELNTHRDDTIDRNGAHAEGFGWPEQPIQSGK